MHYELNKNTLINMKRILSILTALMLFCMGWVENANAQPDVAGRTFTLQCARGYVYYNGSVLAGTANASFTMPQPRGLYTTPILHILEARETLCWKATPICPRL